MADVPTTRSPAGALKDATATVLGVLILLAFAVFIGYLLRNLNLNETAWARATYLFAGVEAVAFAAAGYFFGTQVQRGRVEEAKKEADAARQVKDAAEETAKSERRASRVLAEGVVASAPRGGGLLSEDEDPQAAALLAQARALLRD
jgi:uncharacterized integral membrane protein